MEQEAIPIRWTDDANRITSMFTKDHEGRITVHGLCEVISFDIEDEEQAMGVRIRIGELLAGKPVGDTYKILQQEYGD